MTGVWRLISSLLVVLLGSAVYAEDEKGSDKVSFYEEIRPIFQQHCQGCHQPARPQGGFIMTNFKYLFDKTDSGKAAIVAGHPEKSHLLEEIVSQNGKPPSMPRGKDPLTPRQVGLIKKWIAEGAKDDTPQSAREVVYSKENPPTYALPPVIAAIDYSPDGKYLAVAGFHEVLLHNGEGTELLDRLIGMSERIQSVAFSPDGTKLAVTGGSPGRFGEVQIWDIRGKRNRLRISLPLTFDTIYGASWSQDGKMIAFGCADNSLRAIDSVTGKQVLFQGGHADWVLDTVFSVKDSHLVSVSRDRSTKLTEVATQRLIDNITSITPGALKGGLIAVDRHPKKDELLVGGADGKAKIYRMFRKKARKIGDDYNRIRTFQTMPGRVYAVEYSPDGKLVAVGSSNNRSGEVRIFDASNGKLVTKLESKGGGVYAVSFHPGGKKIAWAGFDGVVRINDVSSGKLLREFVPCPVVNQSAKK